jgi:hypothetical protein
MRIAPAKRLAGRGGEVRHGFSVAPDVVRVRGGTAEWVDVKTGLTSGALVEVFGNLHAGDEIAGRGSDEIKPGTAVRARQVKPAA